MAFYYLLHKKTEMEAWGLFYNLPVKGIDFPQGKCYSRKNTAVGGVWL